LNAEAAEDAKSTTFNAETAELAELAEQDWLFCGFGVLCGFCEFCVDRRG